MSNIIAYCGINCSECPAYLATQKNDMSQLEKIANEWSTERMKFEAKDIMCKGCHSTGKIFSWCKSCDIRKCAIEQGLENCAHCSGYPCAKLDLCHEKAPEAKETLDIIREDL
jgi:hypothetical protein